MKATIDFDDALYRRLKIEAARRGRTVRDLVTEGVRHVLDTPPHDAPVDAAPTQDADDPPWFGALREYARNATDHSLEAMRASVARGRRSEWLDQMSR